MGGLDELIGTSGAHCFPNEEVFQLLLKARDGDFHPSIPVRASASPIDMRLPYQCFYVYMEDSSKHKPRGRAAKDEICVKYNNCARSRVWWSPAHNNCLGMVARKMGMKARSSNAASGITDERRHGYRGHWLALVERPSPGVLKDKTLVRSYLLDQAPSLVQFWVAGKEQPRGGALGAIPRLLPGECSPDTPGSPCSNGSASPRAALAHAHHPAPQLQQQTAPRHAARMGPTVPVAPGAVPEDESKYSSPRGAQVGSGGAAFEPMQYPALGESGSPPPIDPGLADEEAAAAALKGFTKNQNGKNPAFHLIEENAAMLEDSDFYVAKRQYRGMSNAEGVSEDTDEDVSELSFLVNVLDEKDQQELAVARSNSLSEMDDTPERASAGLDASLVAYDIFKSVCETFTPEEFKRWYDLYAQTLFLPNVARGLKYFLDRGDPRLRPDFMFTPNCMFLTEMPVGSIVYSGSYANGFVCTSADSVAREMLEMAPDCEGRADMYEEAFESKMMLLCQHLYFKQMVAQGELNPNDYWFHVIVRVASGRRMVLRSNSRVDGPASPGIDVVKERRVLQVQDVSEAYTKILELPPLPC